MSCKRDLCTRARLLHLTAFPRLARARRREALPQAGEQLAAIAAALMRSAPAAAVAPILALTIQQEAAAYGVTACQQLVAVLWSAGQPLEPADALRTAAYMPLLLEAGRLFLELSTRGASAASMLLGYRAPSLVRATNFTASLLALQAQAMHSAVDHALLHGISGPFAARLAPPAAITAWLSAALALARALTRPALPPGGFSP